MVKRPPALQDNFRIAAIRCGNQQACRVILRDEAGGPLAIAANGDFAKTATCPLGNDAILAISKVQAMELAIGRKVDMIVNDISGKRLKTN